MIKKIIKSKIFLLLVLAGLFVAISSIDVSSLFSDKSGNTKPHLVEEKLDKEINNEDQTEEIVGQENIILEEVTPTEIAPTIANTDSSIDFLIYPNSKLVSRNNNTVVLESNANTDDITEWYKAKIKEYDMQTTSTVKTNTNGNVLNKLSAAGSSLKVEIEISRSNSESFVKITAKLL